jgi:hypothetical protein
VAEPINELGSNATGYSEVEAVFSLTTRISSLSRFSPFHAAAFELAWVCRRSESTDRDAVQAKSDDSREVPIAGLPLPADFRKGLTPIHRKKAAVTFDLQAALRRSR